MWLKPNEVSDEGFYWVRGCRFGEEPFVTEVEMVGVLKAYYRNLDYGDALSHKSWANAEFFKVDFPVEYIELNSNKPKQCEHKRTECYKSPTSFKWETFCIDCREKVAHRHV